jgi:hypothetical protein
MGDIILFSSHRRDSVTDVAEPAPTPFDKQKVEAVRDNIEAQLETMAAKENMPLTVAMAAGRYAAMRLFQLQGRAETMAFIDQCIVTAELWDDFSRQLDEDA